MALYKKTSRAFTLVELLLATSVATMVILVALTTFRSVIQSRHTVQNYTEIIATARTAMKQIRDDLANFSRSPVPGVMRLEGTRHFRSEKPADTLLFYAVSDRTLDNPQDEGDVYEVEYGIFQNEQTKQDYLGRRCAVVSDPFVGNDKGIVACLAKNIQELKIEYCDRDEWIHQWEDRSRIPTLVRITIKIGLPEDESITTEISQVMALRPIPE